MTSARGPEQLPEVAQPARRWLFAGAVLDERSLTLSVNGDAIELERKPLEVLLHLLHHAGEVVTKDELLASVWPGRILSDSSMTSCLYKLREALRDDDQAIVKTVHGYGYRLVAPVTVEEVQSAPRPRFEFKLGEHLPMRPLWSLLERLGTGGHGEAWLARHDKTHERRVYKFAADTSTLVSLKREITIYRLLHDSLGDRPDFVALLDWNLEEPPCFVEYEYQEAGSLSAWAKAQGGIERVPIETRLDLAAQVADALAAAHSVGVLHKDLKPSNVLIHFVPPPGGESQGTGRVQIKLCDFGSGGVLDVQRLERMGITRLGFTQTIANLASSGGTPLYLAPEVIAGQPFTVKSDIYALGVMLYQLIVGNFHKPLAPGWEQDVADELLREDIAQAAEGHPEGRLADAARLAQRLRKLEERRRERAAERAAASAARQQLIELDRMRVRRRWMHATVAVLLVGVGASTALYWRAETSRREAEHSAAVTRAVSDFLNKDLLGASGRQTVRTKDLTVRQLLDRAGSEVGTRFADQPDVAAEVHAALAYGYASLGLYPTALTHAEKSVALNEQTFGRMSEQTVASLHRLAPLLQLDPRRTDERMAILEEVRVFLERKHGPAHIEALEVRTAIARDRLALGAYADAAAEFQEIVDRSVKARIDAGTLTEFKTELGKALRTAGDYARSAEVLREVLAECSRQFGPESFLAATAGNYLGDTLVDAGRYDEAEPLLMKTLQTYDAWFDAGNYLRLFPRRSLAALRLEQRRPAEALRWLEEASVLCSNENGCVQSIADSLRLDLAKVFQQQRRNREAVQILNQILPALESAWGAQHPRVIGVRVLLADLHRQAGAAGQAREILSAVPADGLAGLPAQHPLLAEYRRVDGLLALDGKQKEQARSALAESLQIYRERLGSGHWRTARALEELAGVDTPGG